MIQRKYFYPISLVVLFVASWTTGWFWLARVIENDLEDYAARRAADPIAVSWNNVTVSGYPTQFLVNLTKPHGTWGRAEGEVLWSGPATTLRFFADFGRTISFKSPGTHKFLASGQYSNSKNRALTAAGDKINGQIGFDSDGRLTSLRGEATRLELLLGKKPLATVSNGSFDWSLANTDADTNAIHPDPIGQSMALALYGTSLTTSRLYPYLTETLGPKIAELTGELSIRGALDGKALTQAELERWRDAGGTLELNDLVLIWGPLHIAGSGALALDRDLQPVGALTADIAGLDQLLDLFELAGHIRTQQAAIARIILSILTRAPTDADNTKARIPVTIQNRQLSIGPVPLLRLPAITWGD
ncbi:MAG: hypothetical protein CL573_08810 [Alphaproteobacteria bacterium]|nr:hypothetical protein [Alphaproteobacteria bacterium]HCP00642.1 hypothetical protein [Rhodospirillaceae bacterium]